MPRRTSKPRTKDRDVYVIAACETVKRQGSFPEENVGKRCNVRVEWFAGGRTHTKSISHDSSVVLRKGRY